MLVGSLSLSVICVCCGMCLLTLMHFVLAFPFLYRGPHMNFGDGVFNFIFFMFSLVVTMEIHYH